MGVEIHLNIFDSNDVLIGHKQKEYVGINPGVHGFEWAKNVFENFAPDINLIVVEVFDCGELVECNEFRKDVFLRDELYSNLVRLIYTYESSDEHGGYKTIVTEIKKELRRYAKDKKYLCEVSDIKI